MTKLTACFIETIEQPGKYYDTHGLFLRVYPAGSKNWYQRLTINGKRHEFGLGSANIKSLSKVRKEAFKNFKETHSLVLARSSSLAMFFASILIEKRDRN